MTPSKGLQFFDSAYPEGTRIDNCCGA